MADMTSIQTRTETVTTGSHPELIIDYAWVLTQPQLSKSLSNDPQAAVSLENCTAALVSAYLAVNLKSRTISLKEIMRILERKILLASLNLTRGNQKNAAAILGVKTTTLLEKMRKHAIPGRRLKLYEKLKVSSPQEW